MKNVALLVLAVLLAPASAHATSFVYSGGPVGTFPDGGTLVFPKTTNVPQPSIAANKQLYSDDVNAIWQAELDLRAGIIAGSYHGLVPVTVAPAAPITGVLIFDLNGVLTVEYDTGVYYPILTFSDKFFFDGGGGLVYSAASAVQVQAVDAGVVFAGHVRANSLDAGFILAASAHALFETNDSLDAGFILAANEHVLISTINTLDAGFILAANEHALIATIDSLDAGYILAGGLHVTGTTILDGVVTVPTAAAATSPTPLAQTRFTFGGYIPADASPQVAALWYSPSTGATMERITYAGSFAGSGANNVTWSLVDHSNADAVLCTGTITCNPANAVDTVTCTATIPASHAIELGTSGVGACATPPKINWSAQGHF